jgi:hypothetical protein
MTFLAWLRLLRQPAEYDLSLKDMYDAGYNHAWQRCQDQMAAREAAAEARGFWKGVEEMHKLQTTPKQTQPRIH